METPKLAICLDDLHLEPKAAMQTARSLGFRAIDVAATSGPISPSELSDTGRRHLIKHLGDLGLRLASLRGPTGGRGFHDPIEGERRLDTMRKVIELARRLRVPVVSTTLGPIARDPDIGDKERLRECLTSLADDADRLNITVGIESAGIASSVLHRILTEINCPQLRACCDSGAMLMQGEDPHHIAESLPGRIGLVRARDAVAGAAGAVGYEVPLGEGQLNPALFLAALMEAGFSGDMILTRTTSQNPAAELAQARAEFEKYLL